MQHLELDLLEKYQFERKLMIDWQTSKCVVCKMLLKIDPLQYNVLNSEMSYGDFFIGYENFFLKNMYSDFEIAESPEICSLQNYYVVYQKSV